MSAPQLKRKQTREDVRACERAIVAVLKKNPMRYVTAGWLVDRGVEFSEHTVGVTLRKLSAARTIDYVLTMGFQTYAFRADLAKVLKQRAARAKKTMAAPSEPEGVSDA